jgi:hypothetical protein
VVAVRQARLCAVVEQGHSLGAAVVVPLVLAALLAVQYQATICFCKLS